MLKKSMRCYFSFTGNIVTVLRGWDEFTSRLGCFNKAERDEKFDGEIVFYVAVSNGNPFGNWNLITIPRSPWPYSR